jgi:hypothetical protein
MRHQIIVGLLMLLSVIAQANDCSQKKEKKMNNQPLVVKVNCRANEQCLFEGKDMFLDIVIYNNGETVVGFPLEYVKQKSPVVKLVDTRTKAETFIPTHIASWDLKEKFTPIKPGESVTTEWIITADELRQFGADVDLSAEVTIMAEIMVGGKKVEFRGSDTRRIVSKGKQPVS